MLDITDSGQNREGAAPAPREAAGEARGEGGEWRRAVLNVRSVADSYEDSWCALEEAFPEMAEAIRGLFALDLRAPARAGAEGAGEREVEVSDDAIMLQRVEELDIVVRPMVGGGFAWEDEDGEADGLRHPSWRAAAWAAIRHLTGETPEVPHAR